MFCCFKKDKVPPVRKDIVRTFFNKYFVPFALRKSTKILVVTITGLLIVVGSFSCVKLLRGLNQNVTLVVGSDIYDYFETLYIYGMAGPPAYVVFNNVNYTSQANLDEMELINAELSALNNTIQSPIYSWVSPFQNYITAGVWKDDCKSEEVMGLSFDEQMRKFVTIEIDSDCC